MSHRAVILPCPQWEIFILRRSWAERCTPPCLTFSGNSVLHSFLYSNCFTDWASPQPVYLFPHSTFISKRCLLQKRSQDSRLEDINLNQDTISGPPMQLNAGVLSWKSEGDCRETPGKVLSGEPPHQGADTFHSAGSSCYSQTGPQHSKLLKQTDVTSASIPEPAVRGFHSGQTQQWPLKHCW